MVIGHEKILHTAIYTLASPCYLQKCAQMILVKYQYTSKDLQAISNYVMSAHLTSLTKMKRLLQCCGSVAATLQQLDMYATTGDDKVAN